MEDDPVPSESLANTEPKPYQYGLVGAGGRTPPSFNAGLPTTPSSGGFPQNQTGPRPAAQLGGHKRTPSETPLMLNVQPGVGRVRKKGPGIWSSQLRRSSPYWKIHEKERKISSNICPCPCLSSDTYLLRSLCVNVHALWNFARTDKKETLSHRKTIGKRMKLRSWSF